MTNIKNVGYAPVRIEKVNEARKILEIQNSEQIETNKKPTNKMQTLYNLFIDGRETIEDGLSIRELALILYPNDSLKIVRWKMVVYDNDNNASILKPNDSLTLDQMMIDYNNEKNESIKRRIYYILNKTRTTISRFRRWKTNKDIVLFPRKSPSGKWLYYRIRDDQEFEEVKLRLAKVTLTITKSLERMEDILEMKPEERQRKSNELSERIREKYAKRKARKNKK